MDSHYILHSEGALFSTELFVFRNKICVRSNSMGGERLLFIPVECEAQLLIALEPKNLLQRILRINNGNNMVEIGRQEKVMKLLTQKFSYGKEDPYMDIYSFLQTNKIKTQYEYWPDSDRF